jgi:hypothetical protein
MSNVFHYAFKVKDLASTRDFYINILDLIKKMGAYFSTFSYNSLNNNRLNLTSNFYSTHDVN